MIQNSQGSRINNLFIQARGFTLIEVIIAMFILLVGMLALLNTAAVVIQNNFTNILRDEAATLAQAKMSDIKNTPFTDINTTYLASQPPQPTVLPICGTVDSPLVVTRYFRGTAMNYSVGCGITPLGTAGDSVQVSVQVLWTYKNNQYTHTVATVINSS